MSERGARALAGPLAIGAGIVLIVGIAAFGLGRSSASQAAPPAPAASPTLLESPQAQPLPVVGREPAEPAIPLVFTPADGLADAPTSAVGYQLDDTDVDRLQLAAFLAEALGVTGQAAQQDDGSVEVRDEAGSTLSVGAGPLVPWRYVAAPGYVPGKTLPQDDAQRLVQAMLAQLGVDPDEVDWEITAGRRTVTVTAWQKLGDRRTDLSWLVELGPASTVLGASGFAGTLQPTQAYPVIGAATAVERSQQPGWAAFGPTLLADATASPPAAPTPAATQLLGRPLVIGTVRELVVTDAQLGLAQHVQPDGTLLVVPAYLITADDGSRWTLLAVRDPYVAMRAPQPTPSAS